MNRLKICILVISFGTILSSHSQEITKNAETRAKEIISKMTLQEKIDYISGATSFSLRAMPELGVPEILLADGPQGIRNHSKNSTLYPCGILSASTWNRNIIYKLGVCLGTDARARSVNILLGPGVNIYRSPLCGRNYEYFGEDPYLTGEIAKQYILGVQSRGVISTIKHFCANNQEWTRHHVSSDIDERTLNEIYLPSFRKAVEEAHVGAVMNSYNLVNGVHSTENEWLNIDILRNKWNFKGILMSDWTSVYSSIGAANGGLDLEMPKGRYFTYDKLKQAIDYGTVNESVIDLKVQHILQTLIAFGMFDRQQKDSSIELNDSLSRQTALNVAREGIVLLKNNKKILPLKGRTAVMGVNADAITTGGGSGFVTPFQSVSLCEGLKKLRPATILLTDSIVYESIDSEIYCDDSYSRVGFKCYLYKNQNMQGKPDSTTTTKTLNYDWGDNALAKGFPSDHFSAKWMTYYKPKNDEDIRIDIGGDDGYRIFVNDSLVVGDWGNHSYSSREINFKVKAGKHYNFRIEYFDNISSANIHCHLSRLNQEKLMNGLKSADNVVICTGFNSNIEGEGFDRPFNLPTYQEQLIKYVAKINKNVIVVLNAGGGLDMTSWVNDVDGVVMAWYPGQEGGTALADILTGKISPSGKLPISIEKKWEDNPCHDSYYENKKNKECKTVEYTEGIFSGYRGYDKLKIDPLFPFGFGLSYSSFEYSDLKIEKTGNKGAIINFNIKNTGKFEAAEVAEVFVKDVVCSVARPEKELKGFDKINLKPGETRRVSIKLNDDAFSFYDINTHAFTLQPGDFEILVGSSSKDIKLHGTINM